jgi:hypothetical protein
MPPTSHLKFSRPVSVSNLASIESICGAPVVVSPVMVKPLRKRTYTAHVATPRPGAVAVTTPTTTGCYRATPTTLEQMIQ